MGALDIVKKFALAAKNETFAALAYPLQIFWAHAAISHNPLCLKAADKIGEKLFPGYIPLTKDVKRDPSLGEIPNNLD